MFEPPCLCKRFIAHVNGKLLSSNITVEYVVDKDDAD